MTMNRSASSCALLTLALGIGLGLPFLALQARAQPAGPEIICDDNDTRDRGRSTRRRAGGVNRDCRYVETRVDEDSGEVIREEPVRERSVMPRRYSSIPRPTSEQFVEAVAIPDRWRIVDALGYEERWWDPYNQNTIKGDKPLHDDWFFSITAISDTVLEVRDAPTPVGVQTTATADALDVLGNTEQALFNQNLAMEFVYYQGDTVFRPPDWEFRFTPVFNANVTRLEELLGTDANPGVGRQRDDSHVGIQAAFVDKHLRDVSERYDFDSVRVGIQPFSSDFRGFLFQDAPFGVRLFGTRDNNRYQYNLAWFRRLEKDTNSGLNDIGKSLRDDDVYIANLYAQDRPALGFFSQVTLAYNRNRETGIFYDNNAFIARPASLGQERPRTYDAYYLGLNGDGHFGRLNLTTAFYLALGEEEGAFTDRSSDIEAWFLAAEPSMDFDWIRARLSFLYASGDDNPYDDKSRGFDAIFENPQFAGADTSYWIRQAVPLIGGGRVALSARNGALNSLRTSKEHGQSNFTNPGLVLAGAGADLDLLPELRLSFNANYLAFAETGVLEAARNQAGVDRHIGYDLSAALIWRPFMTQNIVVRASYAQLISGDGYRDLFGDDDPRSVLFNLILTF